MKTVVKWFLIAGMVFSFCTNASAGETIRLATGEWSPFISKDLKHGGVVLHIISEAFASVGIKTEYTFYPWARAKAVAQSGKFDGSAVWGVSSEREKHFYYSDLVMISPYVLFHLKSYPLTWETWDDLIGVPMGGLSETNYGVDFKRLEKAGKMKVQWVPRDDLNFRKLLAGRIKFVPLELDVGYHIINSNFMPEKARLFTHHPKYDHNAFYHLLMSKKNERSRELLLLFNKGLRHLRANGHYDDYFKKSRKGEYIKK